MFADAKITDLKTFLKAFPDTNFSSQVPDMSGKLRTCADSALAQYNENKDYRKPTISRVTSLIKALNGIRLSLRGR